MFLVAVVFEQSGKWSKPYHYRCPVACEGHVVVPAGNYMTCACVISCTKVAEGEDLSHLKYVYGPVSFEYNVTS